MKKLVLNEKESKQLLEHGGVEIERNGFPMLVEVNPYFDEDQEEDYINKRYNITIIDIFDKVVVKETPKENKKKTVLVAKYEPKKMHLYDAPFRGKHPVHLIDGGTYLTESEEDFGGNDMGWFNLNQKEYDYFKSQLKEIEMDKVIN